MRDMKNEYKILVRKPDRKRLLERPWHRCMDNVTLGLRMYGCNMNSSGLMASSCEHDNEPLDSI
jgi:hypothetical protein